MSKHIDCRTCEYMRDALYEPFYCEALCQEMECFVTNCQCYRVSKKDAVSRIKRRIRALERVTMKPDVIEAQKEIDALSLAVQIMEGKI